MGIGAEAGRDLTATQQLVKHLGCSWVEQLEQRGVAELVVLDGHGLVQTRQRDRGSGQPCEQRIRQLQGGTQALGLSCTQ
jgi:hypothetical protein